MLVMGDGLLLLMGVTTLVLLRLMAYCMTPALKMREVVMNLLIVGVVDY